MINKIANCSDRLTEALKIKGMRQVDLCKLSGVPKSAMSQYIKGTFEPKQDRVYSIAKALNVSEAWLMGYDVPMNREVTSKEQTAPKTEKTISVDRLAEILGIEADAQVIEDFLLSLTNRRATPTIKTRPAPMVARKKSRVMPNQINRQKRANRQPMKVGR